MALNISFEKTKSGAMVDGEGQPIRGAGPSVKDARLVPGEYILRVEKLGYMTSKDPKRKGVQMIALTATVRETDSEDASVKPGTKTFTVISERSFGFTQAALSIAFALGGLTFEQGTALSEESIQALSDKFLVDLDKKQSSPGIGLSIGCVAWLGKTGFLNTAWLPVTKESK